MSTPFVSSARQLDRARPLRFRARRALRRAALALLARRPGPDRPGVRIVHYHYVFDDERDAFARQLEYLATAYEPVALSEAVARLREGRLGGRELVVTFDDGFKNQLVNAAPILADRGVSACFFLVTGLLSADSRESEAFCRERLHLPGPVEPMTWDDAEAVLGLGHEVGSHTRSHPDLAAASPAALEEELAGSRAELEQRLGRPVVHLSAPYGDARRFSVVVSDAARRAGYESCATAQRGRNVGPSDLYALRRDHVEARWPVAHLRYFLGRA